MSGRKGQLELSLVSRHPVKRMGRRTGEKTISLFLGFLLESLRIKVFGHDQNQVGEISRVACPFCKKGRLRLIDIFSLYSDNKTSRPGSVYHIGNEYTYNCSNDCGAIFTGRFTWGEQIKIPVG